MRGTWLGFVFFVALITLGFGTLLVGDLENLMGDRVQMTVLFPRVEGLRSGDDVRVDGVPYGKVGSIRLRDDGGVMATLLMQGPVTVHRDDGKIVVKAASVLGGTYVAITRGSQGAPYDLAQTVPGEVQPGLEQVGELVGENREDFRDIVKDIRDILRGVEEGQGTVGKLLKSDEIHNEAVATLKKVQDTADTLQEEVRKAGEQVARLAEKIEKGEGPVAALLSDRNLTEQLRSTLDNIEKASANIRTITEKIESGKGPLARLVSDEEMGDQLKRTMENIEETSESIRKIAGGLEEGEGTVGKLLQDDELYQEAKQTFDDLQSLVGRAARATVEVVGDSKAYFQSHSQISNVGIRISPDADKYFELGAAFLSYDTEGDITFERGVEEMENDTIIKFNAQVAYRIPWFLDRRITVRGGVIEGRAGGGIDFTWDNFLFIKHPIRLSFEGRDAYNDLEHDDIDENIDGPMLRFYAKTPLWTGKDHWAEMLLSFVHLYGGVSRVGEDPDYMAGIGVEFPDEDIRTLVSLIGLAR